MTIEEEAKLTEEERDEAWLGADDGDESDALADAATAKALRVLRAQVGALAVRESAFWQVCRLCGADWRPTDEKTHSSDCPLWEAPDAIG